MPLPPAILSLLSTPRAQLAEPLSRFLAGYIEDVDGIPAQVQRNVRAAVEAVSDAEWASYLDSLRELGADWGRNDAHPVGQAVAWALLQPVVREGSGITGVEHFDAALAAGRRVMLVGNHLSYIDPSAAWAVLRQLGRDDLAFRITAVAGPKVFEGEPMRLMGASAVHTIKVAQSSQLQSNEAELGVREIARIARRCMDTAAELMDAGRAVLIYPEGTRSRNGRLGPFIKGVGRWLAMDGAVLLPLALWGTESIYTLENDRLRPTEVHGAIGAPIDVDALGVGRDEVGDIAREALNALLPEARRG